MWCTVLQWQAGSACMDGMPSLIYDNQIRYFYADDSFTMNTLKRFTPGVSIFALDFCYIGGILIRCWYASLQRCLARLCFLRQVSAVRSLNTYTDKYITYVTAHTAQPSGLMHSPALHQKEHKSVSTPTTKSNTQKNRSLSLPIRATMCGMAWITEAIIHHT